MDNSWLHSGECWESTRWETEEKVDLVSKEVFEKEKKNENLIKSRRVVLNSCE